MSQTQHDQGSIQGRFKVDNVDGDQVTLYATNDELNKQWSQESPSGQLTMNIQNPNIRSAFQQGQEMILTLQSAESYSGSSS